MASSSGFLFLEPRVTKPPKPLKLQVFLQGMIKKLLNRVSNSIFVN